jgi:hypothetical protein
MATFRPEIEPLVRLLERTPRERCAEVVVAQLNEGVSYRQLLAALFLAGVRNINPRPPGFALHCLFVIHSAHLLSLEAPPESRLLPLFYALDNFKGAQERDAKQTSGDYIMRPVRGPLPAPERAAGELTSAMDGWDIERAERAVVTLARHGSPNEVFQMLWRYAARDYRNIGHKAIFAANAARTLEAIGWQHAEPVLRSLVASLLDFGKEQKVNGYALDDQTYANNLKRIKPIPGSWMAAEAEPAAARAVLDAIRHAAPDEACAEVASRIAKGSCSAATIFDAVHLAAAELVMRVRAGGLIAGIHAVTAANGLHHAFVAASDAPTRQLLALQAVGWMGQFRHWAGSRPDGLRSFSITEMEPASEAKSVEATINEVSGNRDLAAASVFRLASSAKQSYLSEALRLTVAKADEVHYYKYLAALVEDVPLVSATWQPRLLAASVYYMKTPRDAEPAAMKRAREALRGLKSVAG